MKEVEDEKRRAAGYYVPHLDDREIVLLCGSVAYMYGEAQTIACQGIRPEQVYDALSSAEARFGQLTSSVFGLDPRLMLRAGKSDLNTCIALRALTAASQELGLARDNDGNTVIDARGTLEATGLRGSFALGVFTQVAGSTPHLSFRRRAFFDWYYVAPDRPASRASQRWTRKNQPRLPDPNRPPARREKICQIMASEPRPDWSGTELAGRLGVHPRNMLTQLAEWTRLGFLAKPARAGTRSPGHPDRPQLHPARNTNVTGTG